MKCHEILLALYYICIIHLCHTKTNITMLLSEKAKQIIQHRDGMRIRNRLAYELDKSYATIERWLTTNDEMLTTASALRIIREETGLTDDQILTTEFTA